MRNPLPHAAGMLGIALAFGTTRGALQLGQPPCDQLAPVALSELGQRRLSGGGALLA